MKRMLLAAAGSIAVVLAAGGAQAQSFSGSGHHRDDRFTGEFVGQGFACQDSRVFRGDGRFDRRRGGRDGCRSDVLISTYGGEWARWNNRSWEQTSYNDWWHETPSRAYPAWMSRNQDCSRPWYSADTLRC